MDKKLSIDNNLEVDKIQEYDEKIITFCFFRTTDFLHRPPLSLLQQGASVVVGQLVSIFCWNIYTSSRPLFNFIRLIK